jgi:hypothetical protein
MNVSERTSRNPQIGHITPGSVFSPEKRVACRNLLQEIPLDTRVLHKNSHRRTINQIAISATDVSQPLPGESAKRTGDTELPGRVCLNRLEGEARSRM